MIASLQRTSTLLKGTVGAWESRIEDATGVADDESSIADLDDSADGERATERANIRPVAHGHAHTCFGPDPAAVVSACPSRAQHVYASSP